MQTGDIYLARFPFGDAPGMKLRPTLLLAGPIGRASEVLIAYISSVPPADLLPTDVVLDPAAAEFHDTNLKAVSYLRLHKLATIHGSCMMRRLGQISEPTRAVVAEKLRTFLNI
jgi:hypothetical protein